MCPGEAGGVGCREHQCRVINAGDGGCGVGCVPPEEGAFVGFECGVERVPGFRLLRGRNEPPECVVRFFGGVPMTRELGDLIDVDRPLGMVCQANGNCAVQRDALVGQDVLEDRLTQQLVPERVAPAAVVGEQHTGVDRGSCRRACSIGVECGRGDEPGTRRPGPDERGGAYELAGVGVERVETHGHEVAQRRRDAPVVAGRDELFDEEGIAVRVASNSFDVAPVHVVTREERGELGRRIRRERLERDAMVGETPELGDELAIARGILGPIRDDDEHRHPPQVAREVAQELTARGVDPMHVVDEEDELRARRRRTPTRRGSLRTAGVDHRRRPRGRRRVAAGGGGAGTARRREDRRSSTSPSLRNNHESASVHGA